MSNTLNEVDLHDEACARLSQPGMSRDILEHKAVHYTQRLAQLQSTNAPIAVIGPVARLQRIFWLALQMKCSAQRTQHASIAAIA